MGRMFTANDFEKFGEFAAKQYVEENTPLNETIVKIAEQNGLNPEQVKRVVENANIETHLRLMKTAEDKYVEFPTADIQKVSSALEFDQEKQAALDSDYFEIIANTDMQAMTKYSEKELSHIEEAEAEQIFFKLANVRNQLQSRLDEVHVHFSQESEKLYTLVKQAILQDQPFGLVKHAMEQAVPDPITTKIVDTFQERLQKEAQTADFSLQDTPHGMLNKNHPIVQSLKKLAVWKNEYKVLHSVDSELEKCGIGAGQYLKSALEFAKNTGKFSKEQMKKALNFLMEHKEIPAAGLLVGVGYSAGKANESQKRSPVNPRTHNIYEAKKDFEPL